MAPSRRRWRRVTLPDPANPSRNLYTSARRLRSALRRMDLESATGAGEECRGWMDRLGRCPPREGLERRWAEAAERVLARCQGLVRTAMNTTGGELALLRRQELRAARYADPACTQD